MVASVAKSATARGRSSMPAIATAASVGASPVQLRCAGSAFARRTSRCRKGMHQCSAPQSTLRGISAAVAARTCTAWTTCQLHLQSAAGWCQPCLARWMIPRGLSQNCINGGQVESRGLKNVFRCPILKPESFPTPAREGNVRPNPPLNRTLCGGPSLGFKSLAQTQPTAKCQLALR